MWVSSQVRDQTHVPLHWQADSFTTETPEKPLSFVLNTKNTFYVKYVKVDPPFPSSFFLSIPWKHNHSEEDGI